jgi:hypothetical protein
MESNGVVGKIQVSQATADLLIHANKENWLIAREEKVEAKGKGMMQTYFVEPHGSAGAANKQLEQLELDSKTERLVSWNVVVLSRLLSQVVTQRNLRNRKAARGRQSFTQPSAEWSKPKNHMVINEIAEIIELPDFDAAHRHGDESTEISLDSKVQAQLHAYVSDIALTYHENPFHK